MLTSILSYDGRFLVRGGPTYHQDFFKGVPILGPEADTHIYIEDIQTGTELIRLAGHANVMLALALSRDDQTLASGSRDGTVRLWRVPEFEAKLVNGRQPRHQLRLRRPRAADQRRHLSTSTPRQ